MYIPTWTLVFRQLLLRVMPTSWSEMEHAFTVGAICVGGVWTYRRFIQSRPLFPHADLAHEIQQAPISPGQTLLSITLRITNTGSALLKIPNVTTQILQVLPLAFQHSALSDAIARGETPVPPGGSVVSWPLLAERSRQVTVEIESKESDQVEFDFVVPASTQVVRVYSFVPNMRKQDLGLGWAKTTTYSFHSTPDRANSSEEHVSKETSSRTRVLLADAPPPQQPFEGGTTGGGPGRSDADRIEKQQPPARVPDRVPAQQPRPTAPQQPIKKPTS